MNPLQDILDTIAALRRNDDGTPEHLKLIEKAAEKLESAAFAARLERTEQVIKSTMFKLNPTTA